MFGERLVGCGVDGETRAPFIYAGDTLTEGEGVVAEVGGVKDAAGDRTGEGGWVGERVSDIGHSQSADAAQGDAGLAAKFGFAGLDGGIVGHIRLAAQGIVDSAAGEGAGLDDIGGGGGVVGLRVSNDVDDVRA